MSRDYVVFMGPSRRRYRQDDGAVILWAGDHRPLCLDCGKGHLEWAEAGHVPWHRICSHCGSHWDLHPITWGPARPSERYLLCNPAPASGYTRWVQGTGEVPLVATEPLAQSGHTWGDLLPLLTPAMWQQAEKEKDRQAGMVHVPGCWARRARFHREGGAA